MRGRGEYIQDQRIRFKKGFQKKYLLLIKKKTKKTWIDLARFLDISEHTLKSDFYNEKSTMPLSFLKKLSNEYQVISLKKIISEWSKEILPKNWGQIKSAKLNKRFKKKKIIFPKESEELAEIIGTIIGDGHIWKKGVRITGNAYEIRHYIYLKKIIKELFDLNSRINIYHSQKGVCLLNIYST